MPAPLVFITGASSGIGQALALRYHRAGWRLALAEHQAVLDAIARQDAAAARAAMHHHLQQSHDRLAGSRTPAATV